MARARGSTIKPLGKSVSRWANECLPCGSHTCAGSQDLKRPMDPVFSQCPVTQGFLRTYLQILVPQNVWFLKSTEVSCSCLLWIHPAYIFNHVLLFIAHPDLCPSTDYDFNPPALTCALCDYDCCPPQCFCHSVIFIIQQPFLPQQVRNNLIQWLLILP